MSLQLHRQMGSSWVLSTRQEVRLGQVPSTVASRQDKEDAAEQTITTLFYYLHIELFHCCTCACTCTLMDMYVYSLIFTPSKQLCTNQYGYFRGLFRILKLT